MKLFLYILLCVVITTEISAQGITKFGQSTTTSNNFVNKNGKIDTITMLTKNGKVFFLASLTTTAISSITGTTASSGGNITSAGSATVTARGVCWSTSVNPTIANSKTIDGADTGIFTSSLTGLTAGTTYYVRAYATNSIGTSYGNQVSFTTTWFCGGVLTINHTTANSVAPENKTVNYGTVTSNISGASKCWITQNLGSTNQASSVTDASEASAGWYWQFNRKRGYKHDGTTRTPSTTWINSISESSDWVAANDPCTIELGSGWRIPTSTEWTNADGSWSTYFNNYSSIITLFFC